MVILIQLNDLRGCGHENKMDKLEHFLKKNHHRIIYYFTNQEERLMYALILSIYDGVIFVLDLTEGDIPYIETGQFQKRFYVEDADDFPDVLREQPAENLIRDRILMKEAFKILIRNPMDGTLMVFGPGYMMDVAKDGEFSIKKLIDFPDSLDQHGILQKYDLEYFYNHKNTISKNVKTIYDRMNQNFIENLDHIQKEWENISKDPSRHLNGIKSLLIQYNERNQQCDELKKLLMNMYQIWKQLSSEHDMMEVQAVPINIEQNMAMNNKRQLLYRKLDRIKLIEKHATDLLVKIHIACTCLMFYIHVIICEMGSLHFRIDRSIALQDQIQKYVMQTPTSIISLLS